MVAVLALDPHPTVARPGLAILEQALGRAVDDLPAAVRRFHASTGDVIGTGTFTVQAARSRAGRLLARALRMPRSVGETPVTLSITRERPGTEQWCRWFGDDAMASTQTADGKYVVERIGPLELKFVPTAEAGRLWFHHVRTSVRIGSVRIRLPRATGPTITASVGAIGDRLDVSVRIRAPGVGTLLAYRGQLISNEAT